MLPSQCKWESGSNAFEMIQTCGEYKWGAVNWKSMSLKCRITEIEAGVACMENSGGFLRMVQMVVWTHEVYMTENIFNAKQVWVEVDQLWLTVQPPFVNSVCIDLTFT